MRLKPTSISLPAEEHDRLSKLAKANFRSLSAEILYHLAVAAKHINPAKSK